MKRVYFSISKARFLKVKDFIFSLKSPCWQLTLNAKVQRNGNFMKQSVHKSSVFIDGSMTP